MIRKFALGMTIVISVTLVVLWLGTTQNPQVAGAQAAPAQSGPQVTTWVATSLHNPGSSTWTGTRRFTSGEYYLVGDMYVLSNQNGDRVPLADCVLSNLYCQPNTGTAVWLSLGANETLDVHCVASCAMWTEDGQAAQVAPARQNSCQVSTDVLNVRSGPGTGYGIINQVSRGTRLQVVERRAGWMRTSVGWVHGGYCV